MLVRAAISNRSLRENLSRAWKLFWTVILCFRIYVVYGLVREKSIALARTAKYVDARYTWWDVDAQLHKPIYFFNSDKFVF